MEPLLSYAGWAPSRPGLSVSRALCAPRPGPSLRAGASASGRPAPSPLTVLSPHPPHARLHALPVLRPLGSRETFLAGVGSAGASAAPQAWEPLPPLTAAERTLDGAWNPPSLSTAQPGQVAVLLQPTHHRRGNCYPTARCSVKSSSENPSHPLAAPGRGRGQLRAVSSGRSARLSQSLWGIQRDHMPHNVHEGTVLEPCPRSTRRRVRRLARVCRLLTLRGADPSLCFEVNSSTGLQVSSTGLQLQDPHGGWDERGRHYRSKNPNSPRDKTCQ